MNIIKYQIDHEKKIVSETIENIKNVATLLNSFRKYKYSSIAKDDEPTFIIMKN